MNCLHCLWGIVFSCLIASTSGCRKDSDISGDEVCRILNEIIRDDSLSNYIVCSKPYHLLIKEEYGFSKSEQTFLERQQQRFKKFRFEPRKLKCYSKRDHRFVFMDVDTSCAKGIILHLSFPLISPDRQRVLLEITEDCNCMLGGYGTKNLYSRENGKWILKKSFDSWISQIKRSILSNTTATKI
ncbi:MAG: hypothetical protein NTW29_06355 [Bacteroidetes bacterium]|nr:hypothetical protein [Bacteroidota bacterium]